MINVSADLPVTNAYIGKENAVVPTVFVDSRLTVGEELNTPLVLLNLNDGTTTAKLTDDNRIYADRPGMARFILGTSYTLPQTKQTYTMYSEPITVTFTALTEEIPADGITLDKDSLTLYVDEQEKLTAAVTPADSTDLVIWSSDNEEVATV